MNEQLKDYNHTLNNEPWTMLRFWQRKLQKTHSSICEFTSIHCFHLYNYTYIIQWIFGRWNV